MTQKYRVARQVLFDRLYHEGETYEADPRTVAHLIERGVLEEPKAKAEAQPKNKAEPKPKNKADR
ncbi:hypothetical protein [Brevundimonas sp.]|uniref:hypothetical protein n=1 Tax=Brevundimonas sp. TaxID=1871086 RepID=UPI00289FC00A|nr:hypothetical protein [Brevundimonas sp.]